MAKRLRGQFNEEFACWEVVQAGRVLDQTIDEDDAREWAFCNAEG